MSKLYYIIGASGAGKDSLIAHCRNQINGSLPIIFTHRYITRPANAGGENHVSISDEEFKLRLQQGLFALNWESHDLYYGIGIEIDLWLEKGFSVVVNGSREYLSIATAKYPEIQPILIEADAELIKARLNNRGREDDKSIAERIARNEQLNLAGTDVIRIQNNGSVDEAANNLLNALAPAQRLVTPA
jgi:ribose 1,5-bisphosphokinase